MKLLAVTLFGSSIGPGVQNFDPGYISNNILKMWHIYIYINISYTQYISIQIYSTKRNSEDEETSTTEFVKDGKGIYVSG